MTQGELDLQIVHYESEDCVSDFTLDGTNQTVWATQQQVADLFGISPTTVRGHMVNIFRDGELDEKSVTRDSRGTGPDGKTYNYLQYNLDAILSVGYRVSSKRATAFRRWATDILRSYIIQGFALNESRLSQDPHALKELAAKVRAIRADEKNIYRGVRDAFAFGSVDYDPASQAARSFFARLQDKFLFATTEKTAAEIVLERADAKAPNMGLVTMAGATPTSLDIHVGKNYLNADELYRLHILCEQFLLFVESRALRGQKLTMEEMNAKFDELLAVQGVPVFKTYSIYLKDRAKTHAEREHKEFKAQQKALKPSVSQAQRERLPNNSPAPAAAIPSRK